MHPLSVEFSYENHFFPIVQEQKCKQEKLRGLRSLSYGSSLFTVNWKGVIITRLGFSD
jgi:hypothetical protein